jgi:hypothetical protein
MSRGFAVGLCTLGLVVAGLGSTLQAQQADHADRLVHCQAQLRVRQDIRDGTEQIAAGLLVRAEKAEALAKVLEAQVKALEAQGKEAKPPEEVR